ncbi:hypothetical protein PR202_gb29054 [Eleusine coracana subsp. coracana]|uniref:Uncharacterized protein n=1 Tax=Eleusine coracana subsp. coracana TaxID=191504 RepID=A0AAV5FY19_ELECO|nr:hypothetical protein PR202_gb29054 [Eleusine coracana subsp. coracana]
MYRPCRDDESETTIPDPSSSVGWINRFLVPPASHLYRDILLPQGKEMVTEQHRVYPLACYKHHFNRS